MVYNTLSSALAVFVRSPAAFEGLKFFSFLCVLLYKHILVPFYMRLVHVVIML